QGNRSNIAETLSQFPIDKKVHLDEHPMGIKLISQMFSGVTDNFLKYMMPILEYFGLFQIELRFSKANKSYLIGTESIKINQFGVFIFNQLKKMGNDLPDNTPTDPFSDL